jgi:hypothetical protein
MTSFDQQLGPEDQAQRIQEFLDYVRSVPPLFPDDFDTVEEVRAARSGRVDRLIEFSDD